MAGARRGQALGLALAIVLIYLLFFSGSNTDFRRRTEASLSRRRGVLRGDLSDADLTAKTNKELQLVLDKQKELYDSVPGQADNRRGGPSDNDEISVAGRKHMPKPKYPVTSGTTNSKDSGVEEATLKSADKAADEGESMAREELQSILTKSPIVIFSKSYCPYSKRAKALLLETYTITPAPYVVELDLMTKRIPKPHAGDDDDDDATPAPTLGRKVQDLLASLTGRRTVPNIMINSQSLGGSDDIAHLHSEGRLEEEIKKMGGKRIVSVEKTELKR
ncbi:hypothetical protein ABEF95_011427 [Exophiala dermatitidis]